MAWLSAMIAPRQLRRTSGVILLVYIALHMLNHMLGLVSLDAAEAGLALSIVVWTSWAGTLMLYGAAATHGFLALRTLYLRRNWRAPPIEWLRLWAGFSMPALLIGHLVSTRVAATLHASQPSYARVVEGLVASGAEGMQLALLAPGWLHGCLGIWITLRRYEAMRRFKALLIALAIAAPALSGAGFWRMRAEVTQHHAAAPVVAPDAQARERRDSLDQARRVGLGAYVALVAAAAGAGLMRSGRRAASQAAAPD